MYKRKNNFSFRFLWQLRYRFYALVTIVILVPLLFSNNQDINPSIDFPKNRYEVLESNWLYDVVSIKPQVVIAQSKPEEPVVTVIKNIRMVLVDKTGDDITKGLQLAGYDSGYISAQHIRELNQRIPVKERQELVAEESIPKVKTLDDYYPRPSTPQFVNLVRYPAYKVTAPLIYASFDDYFEKNSDGNTNFNQPIKEDLSKGPLSHPLQKLLVNGVVHLPFTPQPGEPGNTYIIGHSSNYSVVKSDYNTVFKPLESRTKPGEEFFIYDRFGRELKFKVFETIKIEDKDTATAYKNFGACRVVTLQTSILGWRNGQLAATHRWLTRGVLDIDDANCDIL